MTKKVLIKCLIVLLPVLLCLFSAGRFLLFTQLPQEADVIIVLSGGGGRVEKAAYLYHAGYAPYMILSNATESASASGDMLQTALSLGIPSKAILTEDHARSTYDNAALTLPIMNQNRFNSAIVVSSNFHMRRVKFNFDRIYKKSGIHLTYVESDSGFQARRWWSNPSSREIIFSEYIKFIGNALGYHGPEAKSVLEQMRNWFR